MFNIAKDPAAKKPYGLDWEPWLGADTIAASTWDVPDGMTLEAQDFDDTSTEIVISGGLGGNKYLVRNTIVTDAGYIEVASILFDCEPN